MSLYNMIHGINPYAGVLLAMLGIGPHSVPRFRDCWHNDAGQIVIYTRTGGGNRDFYDSLERCKSNYPENFDGEDDPAGPWNSDLLALPTYLWDEDDDNDYTYALFYFGVPEPFAWVIPHLKAETMTPGEKWASFMQRMESPDSAQDPQVQACLKQLEPLFTRIKESLGNGS